MRPCSTTPIVLLVMASPLASAAMQDVLLDNDSLRARLDASRNCILASVTQRAGAGEAGPSLLATLEPVFHYADPDVGVYWNHLGGASTDFGENAAEREFKLVRHEREGNALTTEAEDVYVHIAQRCALTTGPPGLRIEYTFRAKRDVQQSSWTCIASLRFKSDQYERFSPSYHVRDGVIEPIARALTDPKFAAVVYMHDWFVVRDPETKEGLLVLFPSLTGRAILQRGASYLGLTGPFTEDKFIPRGEVYRATLYLVPFHGDYEPPLRQWCEKLGVDRTKPYRPAVSPTGAQLADTEGLLIWRELPSWKVLEQEQPPPRRDPGVALSAAKGEYEPFQLVLRGKEAMPYTQMAGMTLEFSDLKQTDGSVIGKDRFKYAVAEYVDLRSPRGLGWSGRTPDALIDRRWFTCRPNANTVLWVTLKIPADAAAGEYAGAIQVYHGMGRRRAVKATVPIELRVFDFTMPEERHFTAWLPFNSRRGIDLLYKGQDTTAIYERYRSSTREHRAGFRFVYPSVRFKEGSAEIDRLSLDYFEAQLREHFEVVKMPAVDARSFNIGAGHKLLKTYFGEPSEVLKPLWRARYRKLAEVLREFLTERGWQDRVIFELYDEPYTQDIPVIAECVKILRDAFPEIRVTYAAMWFDPRLYGLVNVWMTGGGYAHLPAQRRRAAGDIIWFGNNRFANVDCLAAQFRLTWWRYWVDGIAGCNHWTIGECPDWRGKGRWGRNRVASWILPGEDGPIDTVRWELTREGLEDYEYLWLLEQAVKEAKTRRGGEATVAEAQRLLKEVGKLVVREGRFLSYNPDPMLLHELRASIGVQIERMCTVR